MSAKNHHFGVTSTSRMKIWRYVEILLAIAIWHQIGHGVRLIPTNATDSTLKYSNFAYSAYSSRQFTNNSTLVFRFKTLKKHGMLFYIDDGGVKEFIDAFLLNGQMRIRLTVGSCRGKQRFINGSFTDLKWHRITLKRTSEAVILAVDSHNTSYKLCNRVKKTDFVKHGPLYVSNFPFEEWGKIKWSFRDSWEISLKHGGFEGCIKTPKYGVGDKKFRRALLLKSERTVPGCRDACKDARFGGKCYNGGKCVNRVVRRECDCRGTGFHGPNCSQVAVVDSMAGLRFNGFNEQKGNFAEFSGWPMAETSQLQFYFKTAVTKPALLAYQGTGVDEDRNRDNDYIEVSLLRNGHLSLQVVGNRCSPRSVIVPINFTDDLWHELTISRRGDQLNFSADNVSAPTITCVKTPRLSGLNGKAKKSLFIGGISMQDSQGNPTVDKWGLLNKIMSDDSWFQGCIALLRYSSATKLFQNVKLLRSHVFGNCSGEACSSGLNMCQHNGKCVDLVTRIECDCEGTGYYGRHCEQSDGLNPTATTATGGNNTLTTAVPDHTGPFKSEPNNNNNNNNNENSGSPSAKEKKDPNRSSSPVTSPGWCVLLAVATLFIRNA